MSQKHEIGHWEHHKIIEISCSLSCDIVKSPAKPLIVVHSHTAALLSCTIILLVLSYMYMENMCIYSTALRKEKEAVCCYVHVHVHV